MNENPSTQGKVAARPSRISLLTQWLPQSFAALAKAGIQHLAIQKLWSDCLSCYIVCKHSPLNCAEVFALNPIRLFLLFIAFAVFVVPAQAQKEDWLPITQHDLEMKQVPGNPGADAIQLYYADFINDQ